MSADKTVILKRITSYDGAAALREAVREMFSRAPFAGGISPEKTVLVKVNALMKARPDEAITTHPAVVSAVIEELKALGARDILIADSPSGPFTPSRLAGIYAGAGFAALEGGGVRLLGGDKTANISGKGGIRDFAVLEEMARADIKIGVGKLKTHALMGMTGAVKLWFGVIPGLKKAEAHCRFPEREGFAAMLCALYEAIAPDFNIIDAVEGMQGNGPSGGEKRPFGFVAGGADGFALDRALCHILGFSPDDALTVKSSVERGLAPADARELALAGDVDIFNNPLADVKLPDSFTGAEASTDGALAQLIQNAASPRPVIRTADCVGCGRCAEICPRQTIAIEGGKAHIGRKNCMRCFCCHEVCPQRAIDIKTSWVFKVFK